MIFDRKFSAKGVFVPDERTGLMRCATIRRWLSAELDGELSPSRRARLADHFETCTGCARYRDHLAAREKRIKALAFPAVSSGFYAQVRMKLAREAETVRPAAPLWPVWIGRWVPQTAMLLIALFLGVAVGTGAANRFQASESDVASTEEQPVDEFLYFAAVPAATDQTDLFREIVYGGEVETP